MHLSTMRKKCAEQDTGDMKFYLFNRIRDYTTCISQKPLNLKKRATYLGNYLTVFK
jgi:hypothetical protein